MKVNKKGNKTPTFNAETSPFYSTYYEMLQAINDSIAKRRIIPTLVLIYSLMDGFSQLANKGNLKGRDVFDVWAKEWMLTKYPLGCDEVDLWSARCGFVHHQNSESNLIKRGKAITIFYAIGFKEKIQVPANSHGIIPKVIILKVEDLFASFIRGVSDCLDAIGKDKEWQIKFDTNCEILLTSFK